MSKVKSYYWDEIMDQEYNEWADTQYDVFLDSIEYDMYIEQMSRGELV